MPTEDTDTEAGGQTEDTGDTGEEADAGDTTSDDSGDRQAARGDTGEKRPPRKERRANVLREAKEAREAAEKEREEWRQRHTQTEAQLAELRARMEERERTSQNQGQAEQRKARVDQLRQQAKSHLSMSAQFAAAGRTAEADKAWEEYQRLNDEAEDLRDELRDEARWEKRRGEIQQSMPNQQAAQALIGFEGQYPWLTSNKEAVEAADVRLTQLINNGRPFNRQTVNEALAWTAKLLRLGGHQPSDASRQRYIGTSQRDGEADSGGSGGSMTAEDVRNNLALKRMALLTFNTLDPEQAYAKYAKEIGSKAMRAD